MAKTPPTKNHDTTSTKSHRNTMRAAGMTEIINNGISAVSFAAQIPIKFSQSLLLGFSLFSQKLKPHEQFIQGIQFLISSLQTAIIISFFLAGKEILLVSALITRVLTLFDMLNKGILLIGWAPSELSKEDTSTPPA